MAKKSGGIGGLLVSALTIAIVGGLVFAWAGANDINSVEEGIEWFKQKSVEVEDCVSEEDASWQCEGVDIEPSGGTALPSELPSFNWDYGDTTTPDVPAETVEASLVALKSLPVKSETEVDYDRSEWKHWLGGRCDSTREQVLREQAEAFKKDKDDCKVISGEWNDPYSGSTFTKPTQLDIDHVVALGWAAKNGGNSWDAATKEKFANDKTQLLAVSASENRSKSDKGPSGWMPSDKSYHCKFAAMWVGTVAEYGLSLPSADYRKLETTLKNC